MEILKQKPASIMTVRSPATYEDIMSAIHANNIPNKTLRAVVNMCKANPSEVFFVVYRSYENSVLMIFGEKPVCVQVEGSKLESLMNHHSKEDNIYVFTYVYVCVVYRKRAFFGLSVLRFMEPICHRCRYWGLTFYPKP